MGIKTEKVPNLVKTKIDKWLNKLLGQLSVTVGRKKHEKTKKTEN